MVLKALMVVARMDSGILTSRFAPIGKLVLLLKIAGNFGKIGVDNKSILLNSGIIALFCVLFNMIMILLWIKGWLILGF